MPDMLVKLYDLPDEAPALARSHAFGVEIRRAMAPDRQRVLDWVRTHSGDCAAGECAVSFAHTPIGCWVATRGSEIVGYACYDATAPDFFGPTRVLDSEQGHGVGTALLLRCLTAMREYGYGYAIIGSVGRWNSIRKPAMPPLFQIPTPEFIKIFCAEEKRAEKH